MKPPSSQCSCGSTCSCGSGADTSGKRGVRVSAPPMVRLAPAAAPGFVRIPAPTPMTPRFVVRTPQTVSAHAPTQFRTFPPAGGIVQPRMPARKHTAVSAQPLAMPRGSDGNLAPVDQPDVKATNSGALGAYQAPMPTAQHEGRAARVPTPTPMRDGLASRQRERGVSYVGVPRKSDAAGDSRRLWAALSRRVHAARQLGAGVLTNSTLIEAARSERGSSYAALYSLWAMDNLATANLFDDALALVPQFEREFRDAEFDGTRVLGLVLERAAEWARATDDLATAVHALRKLIAVEQEQGRDEAWPWLRLGEIAEEFQERSLALGAYDDATRRAARPGREGLSAEAARRNALRLRSAGSWFRPDPLDLGKELFRALCRKDTVRLVALASQTHFSLADYGGHFRFAEPRIVLPALMADLQPSKPIANTDTLEGCGGKRYLVTDGWAGETFSGRVQFMFARTPRGWEWRGIGVETPGPKTREFFRNLFGVTPPAVNQPLTVSIKAPWPAPLAFQAGGIMDYAQFETTEAATAALAAGIAIAACAGPWFPACAAVAGPAAAAAVMATWAFIRLRNSDRPCGWGPSGYYYNQQSHRSHMTSEDAFAIDFARWPRNTGTYPDNLTHGTPVLAVADGVVTNVVAQWPRGDGNATHNNLVDHRLDGGTPPGRYTARYIHLDGPSRIPLLPRMRVSQGDLIGFMDDTGNSFHPHLHFEMRDTELPSTSMDWPGLGRSTRPTPMDVFGARPQTLNDGEEGKCIVSTNQLNNPLVYCLAFRDPDQAQFRDLFGELCRSLRQVQVRRPQRTPVVCASRPGEAPPSRCGSYCVDLMTDRANCGECGRNCGVDDNGVPLSCCQGRCVNTTTDRRNCGLCGRNCGVDDSGRPVACVGGRCL